MWRIDATSAFSSAASTAAATPTPAASTAATPTPASSAPAAGRVAEPSSGKQLGGRSHTLRPPGCISVYGKTTRLRIPSWASMSSNPRFTSSRVSL